MKERIEIRSATELFQPYLLSLTEGFNRAMEEELAKIKKQVEVLTILAEHEKEKQGT